MNTSSHFYCLVKKTLQVSGRIAENQFWYISSAASVVNVKKIPPFPLRLITNSKKSTKFVHLDLVLRV